MGDGIQAAKAGILEIADVFVVNKADRDGADQVSRDFAYMQSLGGRRPEPDAWRAADREDGRLDGRGRRRGRSPRSTSTATGWSAPGARAVDGRPGPRAEIEAIALGEVRARFGHVHGSAALDASAARVVAGELDPYTAADELVESLSA